MATGDKKPVVMTGDIDNTVAKKDHASQHASGGSDPLTLGMIGAAPNKNLLHNWYFAQAVNQMGFTTGSTSSGLSYAFDMWRRLGYASGVLTLAGDGMTIDSTATTAGSDQMLQYLENALPAGPYTLSVLVTGLTGQGVLTLADSNGNALVSDYITKTGICTVTCKNGSPGRVYLGARPGGSVTVKAIKLECGEVQTLAREEGSGNWVLNEIPDYGAELAKCQRFYQLFSSAEKRPTALADFRPSMRATPKTGTISIDGVTYYYADANK